MAKYIFSNKAIEDLSDIWNYTYNKWSENQADKYYYLILESCEKISKNPKIGKKYETILHSLFGIKVVRHIIFYQILNENSILILRILHEQMDIKNRIKE